MKRLLYAVLLYVCLVSPVDIQLEAKAPTQSISAEQTEENEMLPPQFIEELKRAEEEGDSRFFQEFLTMLLYLGAIILFILVLMWILKRLMYVRIAQVNQTSAIKILEHRSLTPKTTVYVLGIFGKAIVIADSINGVTLLSEMDVHTETTSSKKNYRETTSEATTYEK